MAASIAFPYKLGCVTQSNPYKEAELSTPHHPSPHRGGECPYVYKAVPQRSRNQSPEQIGPWETPLMWKGKGRSGLGAMSLSTQGPFKAPSAL